MSSDNCYNITYHDFNAAKVVTGVLNSLVCLMCILAAALIILLKAHKRFIPRLMLILVVATFLYMVVDALELLAISYEGSHNGTGFISIKDGALGWCLVDGFLVDFFQLIIILLWCWVTLHLFLSLHAKSCCIKECWVYIIGLAIALFLSAFPLIPLCPGNTMAYGLTGFGCGLRDRDKSCHRSGCEIAIEVVLSASPLIIGYMCTLGMVTYMLLKLCLKTWNSGRLRPSSQVQYKRALESTWVLAVFIFVGAILFLVIYITYIITHNVKPKRINFSMGRYWVWDTTIEPLLLALIPVSVFIQPGTLKKLRWSELKLAAMKWIEKEEDRYETEYIVTGHLENSGEEERLVIGGSSTTSSEGMSIYGIINT